MNTDRIAVAALSAAVCLALASVRPAQEPVPLGRGVPEGVHVYVNGRTSATPDPGVVGFERAVGRLVDSRVHEDIIDLVAMDMGQRRGDEFRATVARVFDVLGRVDWGTLFAKEIVFAERLVVPMPEYLFLFRVSEDQTAAQLDGFEAMLAGLAEMIGVPPDAVRTVERRSGPMVVFSLQGMPIQIAAGAVGDVIVLSTSTQTTTASMRRLAGDGEGSILASERFGASVAELPVGTESTTFIDVSGLLRFGSSLLQLAEVGAGGDEDAMRVITFVRLLLEELDIYDHVAVSSTSDGTTVTDTALVRMSPGFEESRLVALCAGQQPWADWYRSVPADATSFVFDTGVDVAGLFELVEDLVAESFGEEQTPWTAHPLYRMIRAKAVYVSGEVATVSFPSADGGGCPECVTWVRLEDTEGVYDWLGTLLRRVAGYLGSRGQEMGLTSDGALYEIEIAAFPRLKPVIGVRGDHLVFATSPAAIARVDKVRQGEEPNIRSSQRFQSLGIGAADDAVYIDYAQLDTGMGGLADGVGAVGFFLSLLPEERDTRPVIKVGAILTKLAPALRELDMKFDRGSEFRQSQSPDSAIIRGVYRYR